MRIVVLGAGFGGLEVARRLSEEIGAEPGVEIVLVDRSEAFVAGAAHLEVLAGNATVRDIRHRYADFVHPGVRFVHSDVHRIDPAARVVETAQGTLEADVLVVALGAELDVGATPGLAEAGHEFYSVPGVLASRRALEDFDGGRVLVGVCGVPYKCPPAPAGATLAIHEVLRERRFAQRTEIGLVMPTARPIPPSAEASEEVLRTFERLAIGWIPDTLVTSLDPAHRVALTADGGALQFDLFLGVPVHRVPDVVAAAGLCTDGWVHVDVATMRTVHAGVYALGDIVDIGAPKAGVFAEAQAAVVARSIVARHRGGAEPERGFDTGVCYLDVGPGRTTGIEVTYAPGGATQVVLHAPSVETSAAKVAGIAARAARWFPGATPSA